MRVENMFLSIGYRVTYLHTLKIEFSELFCFSQIFADKNYLKGLFLLQINFDVMSVLEKKKEAIFHIINIRHTVRLPRE